MLILPICTFVIGDDVDRAFMIELYKQHGRLMYRTAKNMLHDDNHAEDMVSEAILSLLNNIKTLRTIESCKIRAYGVSTVRNACLDFIRKRDRQSRYMFLDGEMTMREVPSDMDVLDQMIHNEDIVALKQALKRLPENSIKFYK